MAQPDASTSPGAPLNAPVCPLCGGPNGCAVAATGRFDTPCWCTGIRFSPQLLARLPAGAKNQACVCHRCAEAAVPASG